MEKLIADNKKAFFDYTIVEKLEAGIELVGAEVKSVRDARVNLKDSYIIIKNKEVFLLNAHIAEYTKVSGFSKVDPMRTRKLLLHKAEIAKLAKYAEIQGYTLVPTKMYFKGGKAKVEVGVAKGKEGFNKKQSIKEKDLTREANRQLKNVRVR